MKNKELLLEESIKHLKNMFELAGLVTFNMMQFCEKEDESLRFIKNIREADEFIKEIADEE